MKQGNVRMSDKLHRTVRFKLVNTGTTFQDYVVQLIKKDLKFNDKFDDVWDYKRKSKD